MKIISSQNVLFIFNLIFCPPSHLGCTWQLHDKARPEFRRLRSTRVEEKYRHPAIMTVDNIDRLYLPSSKMITVDGGKG